MRQFDLWWHDLYFYVDEVEKAGSRAWVWSDYVWHHPELFYERMPKPTTLATDEFLAGKVYFRYPEEGEAEK